MTAARMRQVHLSFLAVFASNLDVVVHIVIRTTVVALAMFVRQAASRVVVARSRVPEFVHCPQCVSVLIQNLEVGKDDFGIKVLHSNAIVGAV